MPGSWSYHNNQVEPNRKDQLSVTGGNKVTVVMSKSSDRLSPMMRDTKSKFKKSQSIDEIDIGSYKVYRWVKSRPVFFFIYKSQLTFLSLPLRLQHPRGQLQLLHRAADKPGPSRVTGLTGAEQHGALAVCPNVGR